MGRDRTSHVPPPSHTTMYYFAIKLRAFPDHQLMVEWLATPAEKHSFDCGEYSQVEYMRTIHDPERRRDGFSIKLNVAAEYDNPSEWDWGTVLDIDKERIEFIRATPIPLFEPRHMSRGECLNCGNDVEGAGWKDIDGDAYCSLGCLRNYVGDDAEYTDPDGVYHGEVLPWRKARVGDTIRLTGKGIQDSNWEGKVITVEQATDEYVYFNENAYVYNMSDRFDIVAPSEEE